MLAAEAEDAGDGLGAGELLQLTTTESAPPVPDEVVVPPAPDSGTATAGLC